MNHAIALSLAMTLATLAACKTPNLSEGAAVREVANGQAGQTAAGATFINISKGTFLMGSPSSEPGRSRRETQHRVTITRDFAIQSTEVTQAQWLAVMGDNPAKFSRTQNCPSEHKLERGIGLCPNHPVEQVSWDEAQIFITKLNSKGDGFVYRLPTEAEWEYAARAGSTGPYSLTGDLSALAWFKDNAGETTHAVAGRKPNAWGLYDVHGNVWEWTADWDGEYPKSDISDPVGAKTGWYRVFRGGSWRSTAQDCRSAMRTGWKPHHRNASIGLRLVRTPAA